MTATIWIDVEDVFIFGATGRTPTGIQRLSFELCRALHETYGDATIRLVRQHNLGSGFTPVAWETLDELFSGLAAHSAPVAEPEQPAETATPEPTQLQPTTPEEAPALAEEAEALPVVAEPMPFDPGWRGAVKDTLRPVLRLVPGRLRQPMVDFIRYQTRAVFALGRLLVSLTLGCIGVVRRRLRPQPTPIAPDVPVPAPALDLLPPPPEPIPEPVLEPTSAIALAPEPETLSAPLWPTQPGDVLFAPGAAWFHWDYANLLRRMAEERGLRVALLIYDIIPLRRPEWCDPAHTASFRIWLDAVLPVCDHLFSISRASAEETLDYVRLNRLKLRDTVHPIPIGTGFAPSRRSNPSPMQTAPQRLPPAGSYALFVSTIEARKNHALLFRIWRNLMEQLPDGTLPNLVFAGRIGWLVKDLMQQLANTENLGGRIIIIEHPTDAELAELYRGCRFTLFPSFYEGWGLPVSESLAFGKPCIISNRTSLPEAGGALARYFDPEDVADAQRVIRGVIEDPEGLAAWEAQILREFRPVPWSDSARAVMQVLQPAVQTPPAA